MKLSDQFRGPRLGTKLAVLGLALLVIPFFSYRQLVQMEQLMVQFQSQTLLVYARNIASLFNGREDLFNDLPVTLEQFEPLFAHPLQATVRLDGVADEWSAGLEDEYTTFRTNRTGDGDFSLLLGEREGQLYAHLRVRDDQLIYRDPEYLRLDNADHIRLNFIPHDGDEGRITLVLEQSGEIIGFAMDEDWRFAETGNADRRVQGRSVSRDGGLELEFRFPLDLLGSRRYFGVNWVDVDDEVAREIVGVTQSLPTADKEAFNLVVLRTPEVRNIVQGLGYSDARILVIDEQRRVRAEIGAVQETTPESERNWRSRLVDLLEDVRPWILSFFAGSYTDMDAQAASQSDAGDAAIAESLAGEPIAIKTQETPDHETILAAYPIISNETVIGSVVVEQNLDDIIAYQRQALEDVILVSVLSLLIVLIALLAFAGRLAWRIRNLRREASAAIDNYGRLRTSELSNEKNAGDEIGDLSRAVSNMLSRLHRHNTFLENMPRTLRHEINNPLNTLSTSLQNLEFEYPNLEDNKYLDSAKRGVHRIGSIVQNLADAANLEDSLEAEEMELIDLNELLSSYVANCNLAHEHTRFQYRGPGHPAKAMVSDFRIEQLLDKVIDNAVDFHRKDSTIRVQLDTYQDHLQITVANRGPLLPPALENAVFDSMVSQRGQENRLHFGLGLYVVRVIAEHHGGFVRALNLSDGSGVAVVIQLPLAEPIQTSHVPATESPIVAERVSAG